MSDILNALSEPFPKEVERQLSKGGTSLTYIPVSEVITRLNRVLGVDMWSYEIVHVGRDTIDPEFVTAHVRLSATFVPTDSAPSLTVTKDGVGGQKIKRTRNGDIVDLGDELKGAVSDALKKAAQHFGVGIYLARSEDSITLDLIEEQGSQPVSVEHFEKLRDVLNSQDQEVVAKAKAYWGEISAGKEWAQQNVTRGMLDQMLSFIKSNASSE